MEGLDRHTLQELLASILLEEGLMHDRASKVVDHEVDDRLNLIFSVTGIVR